MLQITFTNEEIDELHYERFHHPHPRVQRKMEALYLKSQKYSHKEIRKLLRISEPTLLKYLRDYQAGGIAKLKELNFNCPQSELKQHQESLEMHFRDHPPKTLAHAAATIAELTGIVRSREQVRHFLKSLGMSCRRVGLIPAKADPEAQEEFLEKKLAPRLEEAKSGERAVFFVDAAHFVLGAYLGFLWCFERLFVKSGAGRQRFNVLGALNAVTHELITVTNDSYINSLSVCELLHKIAALGLTIPITLVLDNARYQKCALVFQLAQSLNIELLYLTTYSPNLNLIERLWKFVKKQCLYSVYYPDFSSFKLAISSCLTQSHTTHKTALDSLLSLHFQSFKDVKFIPC
jgi:transposase